LIDVLERPGLNDGSVFLQSTMQADYTPWKSTEAGARGAIRLTGGVSFVDYPSAQDVSLVRWNAGIRAHREWKIGTVSLDPGLAVNAYRFQADRSAWNHEADALQIAGTLTAMGSRSTWIGTASYVALDYQDPEDQGLDSHLYDGSLRYWWLLDPQRLGYRIEAVVRALRSDADDAREAFMSWQPSVGFLWSSDGETQTSTKRGSQSLFVKTGLDLRSYDEGGERVFSWNVQAGYDYAMARGFSIGPTCTWSDYDSTIDENSYDRWSLALRLTYAW
jgi:hypothetical protein